MPESETLLKVLLVDDEPFITKGLAVLVDWNALGFAIEGAVSNGRQALTFLKKHPVDLIIADIQMPVMDGLELLEIIQRDHLSDAYFVILSGYSDFEYARQAIRFDCMEYLLKPVMTDQLIELLHKVRASCHRNSEGKKRDEAYGKAYLAQNLLALLQDRHDEKTVSFVKTQLRLNGGIRYVYIEAQTDPSEWVSAKQIKALRQNLAAKCREVLAGWEKHLLDAPPEQGGCGVGLIFCHGMAYPHRRVLGRLSQDQGILERAAVGSDPPGRRPHLLDPPIRTDQRGCHDDHPRRGVLDPGPGPGVGRVSEA